MIKQLEMLEDGMASRKTCAPKKNNIEAAKCLHHLNFYAMTLNNIKILL